MHAFGITQEFRGFRDVAQRSAFLVAENGLVRAAWLYGNGGLPDVDALLAACRDLKSSDGRG